MKCSAKALPLTLLLLLAGCAHCPSGDEPEEPELPPETRFAEAVQATYTDAARAFIRHELSAATYLALSRGATARARTARQDPAFLDAWDGGDEDGDLVPDDRDACPGTPPLTPVDERGCEVRVDPDSAPDDDAVHAVLGALGMVASPDCDGAPTPQMPEALKFGYSTADRTSVALALSPVHNQPEGCHLFYEVRVVLAEGNQMVNFQNTAMRIVFQAEEATEATDQRIVFRVDGFMTTERQRLFQVNKYYGRHLFQARAMNGAGLLSNWSGLTESAISFGEP